MSSSPKTPPVPVADEDLPEIVVSAQPIPWWMWAALGGLFALLFKR